MYESHFGLSGPPFQLNPDPAFYFDSRGHSNALAYLKFGVYQGEGFIVVTGEIGAGKTTLVRTLLEGLNPDQVVAAQVVSTQLESGDLLRSIITAFGIPPLGTTKAHLIATLEGFLTALATKNRRALLIVDEAQNLSLEAIEELRMLSNFQLGKHALLQSFLVGQPELRTLLESKSMEQFRQRVIASCHLGPLDDLETRAYIEHRMRRVGWKDQPHFEPDAFAAIHRWTGGIPRRINLLCNRLLLACFLNGENDISAAQVEQTARELRGEVGEPTVLPQTSPSAARVQPEPGPETAPAGAEPVPAVDRERALSEVVRYQLGPAGPLHAPLVCLIDGPVGYMKAGALAQALREQAELPVLVAVNPGPESAVSAAKALDGALPLPAVEMHLGAAPQGYAAMAAQAQVRFDALLDELQPCAVLALGAGDAVLACSLVAVKRGLPLLRVDAGVRGTHRPATDELNAVLMDRIAEVLFTSKLTAHYTLYREGIASSRVHCVGSLMENVLHVALERAMSPEQALASAAVPDDCLRQPQGYLLVTLGLSGPDPARELREVLQVLTLLKGEIPVLWPADASVLATLQSAGMEKQLRKSGVVLLPAFGYLEMAALVRQATCVAQGPEARWQEECATLDVPSFVLAVRAGQDHTAEEAAGLPVARNADQAVRAVQEAIRMRSLKEEQVEAYWDGGPALRIVQHLRSVLPRQSAVVDDGGVTWSAVS
ncbi:UDP-N-acetylglucosamine 2-epimerase [Caldimonas thermodepolymerans]|jgi:putative secretion ATPase, PEP-CTERM locus subfamily|uniref:ATPase n=1 Tax=Caldimonas thermodepolymerans TaxID=215580 RepID=A0A2S5T2I8_9BURK|nr:XrtA/PEP-CTERM system-associated ATPase [Caldimonas thermodepolymerans]PPE69166.1 ATPase [Caldimonas thermodepolymerans]QPC32929.1 UDP-N-acetylglucosamine 2-epimerase [Caldimonas thermodepolymerans]RDI03709.1 UDP-N-acetylglucosamine 2-epimerase [Caldimonas thermodepolymerans]TCP09678.1 UDP-N-acetylglucosamine 2-epimerase [Caldimonas thermodepolymerans]UZG45799.1 XrtA-associated ATPase [Caldimonas thermodepolymerans]